MAENPNAETPLSFPKLADKQRIMRYAEGDKLFAGHHYDAFLIKGDADFNKQYNQLRYVVANFCGLLSRVMADVVFGEKVAVKMESEKNQKFVDALFEKNELFLQLYESELANSRRGDSVFKVRVGQRNINALKTAQEIIIEEIDPAIYFPVFDAKNARYTPSEDVLAWTYKKNGSWYLQKEIHTAGFIRNEIYSYDPDKKAIVTQLNVEDFGLEPLVSTGVDVSLIVHIPNVRDVNGFWGTSDYADIKELQFALNNRITKTDNILDKHSDPILAVPPGVLDEDGKVRKEALGMFEVDNENAGFNKPEYIVWNANLESAFSEIDRLVSLLFMFSEVSPAASAQDKDGQAESGRALKFKMLATLRKRNRKIRYYAAGMSKIIAIAIALGLKHNISIDGNAADKLENASFDWGDGVINDTVEMVEIADKRISQGTMSKSDAIVYLDDLPEDEAKDKVKEIDEEGLSDNPILGAGADHAADKPLPTTNGETTPAIAPQGVNNGRQRRG